MNTSAITNPASILPSPAQGGRSDAASASDASSFNQVLSREIADRNSARNTQKESADNADAAPKESGGAPSPDAAQGAKTDDDKSAQSKDGDPASAADMLALVVSLAQVNGNPAQKPVSDAATAAASIARKLTGVGDKGIAVTDLAHAGKGDAALGKDASVKLIDFSAALNKADEQAAAAKSEAELSAAQRMIDPQTIKTQDLPPGIAPAGTAPLSQTALQQAAAAAGAQANKLAPQVGNPGWDQALGQKMVWMVEGSQQSASLTLNPPDLGPLQVVLNVTNNHATANFIAAQPEVRQALEAAMPKLRDMLGDAGIQLGQANVSAGTPNHDGAFGEQRQASSSRSDQSGDTVEPAMRGGRSAVSAGGLGMVDTFA